MGERMARFILRLWENPVTRQPLLAIMRSALTNETAAAVFRGLIDAGCCSGWRGNWTCPTRSSGSQLAAGQLVGIAMLRYVIKVEPLASADPEEIIAMVAPTLQRYLTPATDNRCTAPRSLIAADLHGRRASPVSAVRAAVSHAGERCPDLGSGA